MRCKQPLGTVAFAMIALAGSALFAQQAIADDDDDLAKKLQNPIADLISVPVKLDWDTGAGAADADRSTYVVQPVIPISLNDKWNVISRTIVPVYVDAESPVVGGPSEYGLGDVLQSFFFSPKAPTSRGWVWGVGPALSIPTGADGIGAEKLSIGPTGVALRQVDGWTYGALANHLWSVAGDDDRPSVSNTFLQPFLSYTFPSKTTLGANTESTYNWNRKEWTVPVNFTVSQLMRVGKQPIQLQAGYRNYLQRPDGGPDWGLRFQVTFLFPK